MELEPLESECVFSNSFFDDEDDDIADQALPPSPKRSRVADLGSVVETQTSGEKNVDDDNVLHIFKSGDQTRTEKDVMVMEKSVTHALALNAELHLNANKIYYAKKSVPPFEEPVQQISNKGDEKIDQDNKKKGAKTTTQRKKKMASKKENKEPKKTRKASSKKKPNEKAKEGEKGVGKKKSTAKTTLNDNVSSDTAKEADSNKDKKKETTAKGKTNKTKTKKSEAKASSTPKPKTPKRKPSKKATSKGPSFPQGKKMMKEEEGVLHGTRIATLSRASSTSSLDEESLTIDQNAPKKKGEKNGANLQRRPVVRNEIYVECCIKSCAKWRFLSDVHDASEVPEYWTCSMNPDPMFNSCDKPESTNMASSSQCIECN